MKTKLESMKTHGPEPTITTSDVISCILHVVPLISAVAGGIFWALGLSSWHWPVASVAITACIWFPTIIMAWVWGDIIGACVNIFKRKVANEPR